MFKDSSSKNNNKKTNNQQLVLENFPIELWQKIFYDIDIKNLFALKAISKFFNKLISELLTTSNLPFKEFLFKGFKLPSAMVLPSDESIEKTKIAIFHKIFAVDIPNSSYSPALFKNSFAAVKMLEPARQKIKEFVKKPEGSTSEHYDFYCNIILLCNFCYALKKYLLHTKDEDAKQRIQECFDDVFGLITTISKQLPDDFYEPAIPLVTEPCLSVRIRNHEFLTSYLETIAHDKTAQESKEKELLDHCILYGDVDTLQHCLKVIADNDKSLKSSDQAFLKYYGQNSKPERGLDSLLGRLMEPDHHLMGLTTSQDIFIGLLFEPILKFNILKSLEMLHYLFKLPNFTQDYFRSQSKLEKLIVGLVSKAVNYCGEDKIILGKLVDNVFFDLLPNEETIKKIISGLENEIKRVGDWIGELCGDDDDSAESQADRNRLNKKIEALNYVIDELSQLQSQKQELQCVHKI